MNDIKVVNMGHHVQIEVNIPEFPPEGVKLRFRQSHDEAVHFAAALVEASLLRCTPELREKFCNLIRDMQK